MKNPASCLHFVAFILMASATARGAAPDLVVRSTSNRTASVAPGGTVTVLSTVKNIGKAKAGKSTTRFYLSQDTVKDAGDIRLTGSRKVPALASGKSNKTTTKLKVPAKCPAGTYYLIASADDLKKVRESSEKNNTRKAAKKVIVKVSKPITDGFVLIPAGPFTMGRTSGDEDIESVAPPVTVTVSSFYMEKYEVTKALWDEVRTYGAANGYTDLPVGGGKAADHPVHTVSSLDAMKWCNARSEKEGLEPCYAYYTDFTVFKTGNSMPVCNWNANGYRLPTEAEWEKAARGGVSGKRFPWGTDTISHSQANYYARGTSYGNLSGDVGYPPAYAVGDWPYTSPVGSFPANGYGLHDMAGNLCEWCFDMYDASTYVSGATNPRGPLGGWERVIRGGSWSGAWSSGGAFSCRVAFRRSAIPNGADFDIGFRVARSSVP